MIKNTTKNTVLAKSFSACTNAFSQSIGLRFQKPRPMVFAFKNPEIAVLDSFFVFSSIDVLFLSKKKKVIETRTVKPFTFCINKKPASYIIELEAGKIKSTKTAVGDTISFHNL